ncbi:MAG: MFS transporter [Ilumatobacteraceae bacterium]
MRPRLAFSYLFGLFFIAAASETLISPLFPLIRADLDLRTADLAIIIAALTLTTGLGNLVGGIVGVRYSDHLAVRIAAWSISVGALISGLSKGLLSLTLGQMLIGAGSGLFFAPGLSSISRLYAATRGRAIAGYGLAYSLGLAVASFCANSSAPQWRVIYVIIAIVAASFTVRTPNLFETSEIFSKSLGGSVVEYVRQPMYRLALVCGVVAGTTHFLVIGLIPEAFVDRGEALAVVTGLIGAGRILSMGGKYLAGWTFDRWGGPRSAQIVMSLMAVFGILVLVLPARWGLIPIVPFVAVTAMLFPISNAMVVSSLPPKAAWGVGIYRATLMIASALLSVIFSVALRRFDIIDVMLVALCIPIIGLFINRRQKMSNEVTSVSQGK